MSVRGPNATGSADVFPQSARTDPPTDPAASSQTFYLCSIDGYDPDNSARWCGCGCGSDYNRMVPVDMAGALKAADERIRELRRWLTKAHGESYRAHKALERLYEATDPWMENAPPGEQMTEEWAATFSRLGAARVQAQDALKGER